MSRTIAVLGLGAMGLPMAKSLATKFHVIGYDPDPERLCAAEQACVAVSETAVGAVSITNVALLAVRDQAQLDSLLYGTKGIARALPSASTMIITSTIGADAAAAAARRLHESGIGLVDAPVSGGPARAEHGELLIAVGAAPDQLAIARPFLEALSSTLIVVGDHPGAGQAFKTVNQLLCGVHIAAACEALALADKLGLDLRQTLDALGAGAAASFMLADRGPRIVQELLGAAPPVLSRTDIFVKDLGIVTRAAKQGELPTPLAAVAEQSYLLAQAAGHGAEDDSSLVRILTR
ncbi:MAG: NAD(P)-dependent oxidoreductase [Bifidobacteriaceae bacterium]|jgi:3-hydroxyisobutyrate dehydrogenase|nr:NAD(P)-dependent oxidoreductase [Bifidobacteriaceae bacterium]